MEGSRLGLSLAIHAMVTLPDLDQFIAAGQEGRLAGVGYEPLYDPENLKPRT